MDFSGQRDSVRKNCGRPHLFFLETLRRVPRYSPVRPWDVNSHFRPIRLASGLAIDSKPLNALGLDDSTGGTRRAIL